MKDEKRIYIEVLKGNNEVIDMLFNQIILPDEDLSLIVKNQISINLKACKTL